LVGRPGKTTINKETKELKELGKAENTIRKNQQQVDKAGNNIERNRPDIQYDKVGLQYNEEFDHKSQVALGMKEQ